MIIKTTITDDNNNETNIKLESHTTAKDDINRTLFLNIQNPYHSSLLMTIDEPDELGDNEEKATKAKVDVVISPSAVI